MSAMLRYSAADKWAGAEWPVRAGIFSVGKRWLDEAHRSDKVSSSGRVASIPIQHAAGCVYPSLSRFKSERSARLLYKFVVILSKL